MLRRDNIIEDWTDRELLATDKWDKKIKDEMEEADVFICLLSADFVASDYIWNTELKKIFTHLKEKGSTVIFIYVEPFDLGSIQNATISEDLTVTKILDFEIKPKDENGHLKAASEWKNEHAALAEIAKDIRLAIVQKTEK